MATFTVETGGVVAGANAYVSLAAFKAYHDDRGNDYSAYSDASIQTAIVRATSYIDATYTFEGDILNESQSLAWPRTGVYDKNFRLLDADSIPAQVIAATSELALYGLANALTSVVTGDDRVSSVKAGSVAVTFASANKDQGTRYIFVDRLLADLLAAGGSSIVTQTVRGW